jgi:hypothetical protein
MPSRRHTLAKDIRFVFDFATVFVSLLMGGGGAPSKHRLVTVNSP